MFSFFKKKKIDEVESKESFELELTASVLAYEIARSDGEISESELEVLLSEIKKIAINNKKTDVILEKKKQANDKRMITKKANLKIFTSSIFFPTQINKRLLHKVADA